MPVEGPADETRASDRRLSFFFFFQAEDGIRDVAVTGVQTCALPISFIADPDNAPLTITYAWTRNGSAVAAATGSAYPPGNQVKGDVIAMTITASDGQLSTAVTASTTIADTPAVLTAAPPTTATYGVQTSFKVTASDVDGDPTGPIEVDYGPAGFSVDSTGQVQWTPSGPMFDRSVDVN